MSKFCTKCGRPLEEEEICTCQNEQVVQQSAEEAQLQYQQTVENGQEQFAQSGKDEQAHFTQQPIQQVQSQQQATPSDFSLYLKRFWTVATKTVKSPASMLGAFAKANDFKVGLGFVGVNAVIFSLFIVILFGKIDSAFSNLSSLLGTIGSLNFGSGLKFPLAKIFFVTLILTFCGACVLAALLLFFTKVIFKYNTSYKQMLCVASAKSLASAPFSLLACIVIFIVPSWSLYVISFGTILGYFYVAVAMKGTGVVDEDKLTYILFFSFAAMVVVSAIAMRITYKMYLPSIFTGGSSGFGSMKGFGY